MRRLQLYTSRTTAASSGDCLLLPTAGGLLTKSRQNRTFDPDCSQGYLRACPFLGSWRALVCGEIIRAGAAGDELQHLFGGDLLAL